MIVKILMGQYRTREHGIVDVLTCHSGPQTDLRTGYTQYKDEGGHAQQSSAEIGKLKVEHYKNHNVCFMLFRH